MKYPTGYQNRIRELRRAKGWSQIQLAEITQLSRPTIARHESHTRPVDSSQLAAYCEAFACTPNDVFRVEAVPA